MVARAGSRFNFEAVPWAVCFAVDLTALRATAFLIDGMPLRYPFAAAAIAGSRPIPAPSGEVA